MIKCAIFKVFKNGKEKFVEERKSTSTEAALQSYLYNLGTKENEIQVFIGTRGHYAKSRMPAIGVDLHNRVRYLCCFVY